MYREIRSYANSIWDDNNNNKGKTYDVLSIHKDNKIYVIPPFSFCLGSESVIGTNPMILHGVLCFCLCFGVPAWRLNVSVRCNGIYLQVDSRCSLFMFWCPCMAM